MNFGFENKIYLILLLIVPFVIYYGYKTLEYINKNRKIIIIAARSIAIVCIVLALTGTSLYLTSKNTSTIFLIDSSQSVYGSEKEFNEFVTKAIEIKPSKDKIGVVSFGEKPKVETFISRDGKFSKVSSELNKEYTNIESAINYAISLFPNNTKKRIVLLSDGSENDGKALNLIPTLKEKGIDLKVYKANKKEINDTSIDKITVSEKVSIGQNFDVNLKIKSNVNTKGTITLYSGNNVVGKQEVNVNKGDNNFVFKDKAESSGFKNYRASIECDGDGEVRNNEASAYTEVIGKPNILVLEDRSGESDEFINILNSLQIPYKKMDASVAPETIDKLTEFKAVVTCNVSVDNMSKGFVDSIESYVKDFGGGYIALGGDNSYALGGYMETPLEKVLPVNMELKGKKEIPKMSLSLVIDRSGSMSDTVGGVSNLDLAKEGAMRSLKSLRNNKDEINVITFDDAYSEVVEKQVITDEEKIISDISSITLGGGTSIIPGLTKGYENIKSSDAKVRHIILLTDGEAEKTGYNELIEKCKKDNITISTVAVGGGADRGLLQEIAKGCNGRYYEVSQGTDIPEIFAKETFLAQKYYLNNREFTPIINSNGSVLSGVSEGGLPSLYGYIGASAKSTSNVCLKSDEDDPILTTWQYGLGKTVAWNSDVTGQWSKNYVGWKNFQNLWSNILGFVTDNFSEGGNFIEVNKVGTSLNISFKKENESNVEKSKVKATIITPSNEKKEILLTPKSAKEYTGIIDVKETGNYMIQVTEEEDGKVVSTAKGGYANSYSTEFSLDKKLDITDQLVEEVNGTIITDIKDVYKENKNITKKSKRELDEFFIIVALFIFILDIAYRRLDLHTYIEKYMPKFQIKIKSKKTSRNIVPIIKKSETDVSSIKSQESMKKNKMKNEKKSHNEEKVLDTKSLIKNIKK
ncbi:FixH family protein [Clostridium senegalense]|uniref:VWA domain-containing protein n=1 Tax=Clostridium senegalense TaxID=1465809 RepID=A0A6M0H8H3_9CLOT|nr:FixH family protein [Clostridium senegalense]NEU06151.1 VWA domain-containing protein [Clostridium senegalense]